MRLQDVLEKTTQHFKQKGIASARLDAELLLSHILKLNRVQLYLNFEKPLSEAELMPARDLVRRRASGEPIAYILGARDFFKSQFKVGPGVLIPRPETELLVEYVINWSKENSIKRIIDLGTGSGCILLSILKELSSATGVGVEASSAAAQYFSENLKDFSLQDRVQLVGSQVESLKIESLIIESKFDVVVANPPYIAQADLNVAEDVRKFEPAQALFSGETGLEFITSWSGLAADLLRSQGLCIFEIGATQGLLAKNIFKDTNKFEDIEILKDYSGLDRFIKARRTL